MGRIILLCSCCYLPWCLPVEGGARWASNSSRLPTALASLLSAVSFDIKKEKLNKKKILTGGSATKQGEPFTRTARISRSKTKSWPPYESYVDIMAEEADTAIDSTQVHGRTYPCLAPTSNNNNNKMRCERNKHNHQQDKTLHTNIHTFHSLIISILSDV